MDLVILVLGVAVLGFLVWLITTKIQMDPIFRIIIYVIVVVALVVWVSRQFAGSVPNVLH